MEWNSNGTLLATASTNDTDILMWDVDNNRNTPLKRIGFPCTHLKWSPNGERLFSATVGNVFRVWEANKWAVERWVVPTGSIQSAAWSPCSRYLLFVTSDTSTLFNLCFVEDQLSGCTYITIYQIFIYTSMLNHTFIIFYLCYFLCHPYPRPVVDIMPKHALPVADLTAKNIDGTDVGGLPQSICWSPNGKYVAVLFKTTTSIAIFNTSINRHSLNISPQFFIHRSTDDEHPSFICFQANYAKNSDTILTVAWSTGRVQYYPIS